MNLRNTSRDRRWGHCMMELRLTKGGDSCGAEVHVRFPAEPDAVWEAISELEQYSTSDGPVQIEEAACPVANLTRFVRCADLDEGSDIQKLNILAVRIDSMSQQEQQLYSTILSCECPPNLDELLRLAGDLNRYELLDGITTDWDLGKWAVENKKLGTNIPESVWSYLDYGSIGRDYAAKHGGEFCSRGYVKRREDTPVQAETPKAILLTLTVSEQSRPLVLPTSEKQLEHIKESFGIKDFSQAVIKSAEYMAPYLDRLIPLDCITVEDANELACCLQQLQSDGGMMKYCCALAAEQPDTFSEALNIAIEHDDYEQVAHDTEEYGKRVLRRIGADDEIIDTIDGFMDFAGLGRMSMEEDGVRQTVFGLVRRLSKPFPPEQESGMQMQ